MSINHLNCRLCLVQCSDNESPFWHYEHLLNQYDDFVHILQPLPTKICANCCRNLARLVAFRDRIRSTQQQVNEMLPQPDLSLSCRVCKTECEEGDLKASTVPFVLQLCSAMSLVLKEDFWGRICGDCVEDLKVLGYYVLKYKEVQVILELKEFDTNFKRLYVDTQHLLSKCHKTLTKYRTKNGDELCKQELTHLTNLHVAPVAYIEDPIHIQPNLLFAIGSSSIIKSELPDDIFLVEDVVLSYEPQKEMKIEDFDLFAETSERATITSSTDIVTHACDICEYSTHNKYKLKYHKRTHKEDNWLYCDLCSGRSFGSKTSLMNHMKRFHLPRETISCHSCNQQFTDYTSKHYHHLSKHVDSSLWKFSCANCGKKCYSKGHLKDHEKIHTGETLLSNEK